MQLKNKTALVTGSTSGIGLGIARAFAREGANVILNGFGDAAEIEALRAGIERDFGVKARHDGADMSKPDAIEAMMQKAIAEFGSVDLLVNNAGIGLLGGAEESSTTQAQALFDVNVFGVIRLTNAVLPTMRRQAKGRIVNLSSVLGLIPAPYSALYASTKHAIEGYSESLDHELRAFGIRVVLVETAYTRTSFEENLAKPDQLLDLYNSARAGIMRSCGRR